MILKIALKHLLSRPFLSVFTLAAVAGSLTMLGAFWAVIENLERVRVSQAPVAGEENLPGLTVFVDSKTSPEDLQTLKNKILSKKKFSAVDVIAPEQALKSLEQQFGETLSKAFATDSLPITLKLRFDSSSLKQAEFAGLLNDLRGMPGVIDVDDGATVLPTERVTISSHIFSWATGLLILVFAIVALLVSHLIRIAFESLRPEVETLKVIGASKFWIFRPLLLEGLFFGILGALGSLILLWIAVNLILPKLNMQLLPKGLEIVGLSGPSSLALFGLGVTASVLGALFTWPLIAKPATDI